MPISGPNSYLPTIDEFVAHWNLANTANGSPIILPGTIAVADLSDLRASLAASQETVQDELNEEEINRAALENSKVAMLGHLNDFNRRVRGLYPGTVFERALPDVPSLGRAMGLILRPLQDMKSLWAKINSSQDPTPFLLTDDYSLAAFTTDLTALDGAYQVEAGAAQNLKLARDNRNVLQAQIIPILTSYRRVIEALFAPDSAIVASLPALYPAPGHTPEAVIAEGSWDSGELAAVITYSESTDGSLEKYELRRSTASPYDVAEEVVVTSNLPADPRTFTTTAGLASPGATALFRVYVILTTGNEKGSDTVTIERPAE